MKRRIPLWQFLGLFLLMSISATARELPPSFSFSALQGQSFEVRTLPEIDQRALLEKDQRAQDRLFGQPFVFAEPRPFALSLADSGTWETLEDGSRVWRLGVRSSGAQHLNLFFERFVLPAGASLWLYNSAGDHIQGPYTAADQNAAGGLWTALVYGEEIRLELVVPAFASFEPELELTTVNHGFSNPRAKQGSCNNDVVCPEADPFRDQSQAVVRLSIGGNRFCSGQLVNNTASDSRPLLLTAYHCILNSVGEVDFDLVPSFVAYFNFESPTCGALSGGSLEQTLSGATFVAGHQPSDFLLVELDQSPQPEFAAYLAGWNVSGDAPLGGVGIHHPSADEKAISFDQDPITTDQEFFDGTHWRVGGWEDGTTEGGSSGSCLYDPADGLCVGTLTGGFSSCLAGPGERTDDFYGKLSVAWEGGGTPTTRLRDWLDPTGSGVESLQGRVAQSGGSGDPDDDGPGNDGPGNDGPGNTGPCVSDANTLCLGGGRFEVGLEFRSFEGVPGLGQVSELTTPDSGLFYFFDETNLEFLVKIIEGCSFNNHYWVFAAGTTDLEYSLTVTDLESGLSTSYDNALGNASPAITDTGALAVCP